MDEQIVGRPGRRTGPLLAVELFVQGESMSDRQLLRVVAGTPVREVLARAGHADAVEAIAAGRLGLAQFGQRAGLDDPVTAPTRIEVLLPITADAKAWRHQRVAARRASKRSNR